MKLLDNGCILPSEYCNILWKISWVSIFSGMYALYNRHYDLAPVPFGVWLTSINYWRHPDYSWRRYLDIFYVNSALFYQLIRAHRSQNSNMYYSFISIAMISFPISIYYHNKGKYWLSTLFHCNVHIFGNITNIILYSGYIQPMIMF
jgi:hypothetical protein